MNPMHGYWCCRIKVSGVLHLDKEYLTQIVIFSANKTISIHIRKPCSLNNNHARRRRN